MKKFSHQFQYSFVAIIIILVIFTAARFIIHRQSRVVPSLREPIVKNITQKNIQRKLAAITFDDGPYGEPTAKILDILEENHVTASFFLVGQNVEKYPDLVRREIVAGHVVENHTWNHDKELHAQTAAVIAKNLLETDSAIEKIIGHRPRLFRPPYGYVSPQLRVAASSTGHSMIMWNVAPRDYDKKCDAQCIVTTVLQQARGHNQINIDLHDGRDVLIDYPRDNIVTALPIIISELKKQGYEFVTVNQLLDVPAYQ